MPTLGDLPEDLRNNIFEYYFTEFITQPQPRFCDAYLLRTSHQICREGMKVAYILPTVEVNVKLMVYVQSVELVLRAALKQANKELDQWHSLSFEQRKLGVTPSSFLPTIDTDPFGRARVDYKSQGEELEGRVKHLGRTYMKFFEFEKVTKKVV